MYLRGQQQRGHPSLDSIHTRPRANESLRDGLRAARHRVHQQRHALADRVIRVGVACGHVRPMWVAASDGQSLGEGVGTRW